MAITDPLSVILPIRKRPDNLKRFFDNVKDTSSGLVNLIFYIDNDDPQSIEDVTTHAKRTGIQCDMAIGPRIFLSEALNVAAANWKTDYAMIAGDDVLFKVKNWDRMVVEEIDKFPAKIGIVSSNDGYAPANFLTHFGLHRNWVKVQGYLAPSFFCTDYTDTWYNDIADILGVKKVLPVLVEHLHYLAGKAQYDDVYRYRVELKAIHRPDLKYDETFRDRLLIANNLKKFIRENASS